jgi:thymidine phosphorylase
VTDTRADNKAEAFDAVDIIRVKRDKGTLSPEQIDWTIDAYTRGVIADEQMAALNMAILLNGMDRSEIARWTAAMIASGERMDFSSLRRPDGATGGRFRRCGSAALRQGTGPHRRHPGQAGGNPRLAG